MPAVTNNLYDQFRLVCYTGQAPDFTAATDTIRVAIVTGAYTLDQNLHDFFSDVDANEVSGTGYTADGNAATSITPTVDGAGLVKVDIGDPATWTQNGAGFSNGRRAIVQKDTGVNTTSNLIAFSNDFGSDQGNLNGDFTVTINAAGLFTAAR